jgi:hypothetical protein
MIGVFKKLRLHIVCVLGQGLTCPVVNAKNYVCYILLVKCCGGSHLPSFLTAPYPGAHAKEANTPHSNHQTNSHQTIAAFLQHQ